MNTKFEPVIGLEIHIELSTKSKMFCACSADYFGAKPNTHTCPICLGLPGAIPRANKEAIKFTQKFGSAMGCELLSSSKFDRKNYFYPDLAKGFQISQYDLPFTRQGIVEIKTGQGSSKKIRITRAHLEEDTGKLTHATINDRRVTLIDFNRSGVPLMEIVSEPDMNSAQEAKLYAQKIRQIARYLEISDADMEKGSMRIEPNVSLRKKGSGQLPNYKVELKNINSFKFAEKAINYEIERQIQILENGKIPEQETRGFNEQKGITVSQRTKEFAHDYRYFPEPDLPPFHFSTKEVELIQSKLPELPDEKFVRFKKMYGLSDYDIEILIREKVTADYFDEAVKAANKVKVSSKTLANVVINEKPDIEKTLPADLVSQIFKKTVKTQISDDELEKICHRVISENKKAVEDFKKGKESALAFLFGQVQRNTKGGANPQKTREILHKLLTSK